MNPTALDSARNITAHLRSNADRLVIDGDAHATDPAAWPRALRERAESTPDYFHGRPVSAEDLVAEMDAAGVDAALIWQNPSATEYSGDPAGNAEALLRANRYIYDSAVRYPGRFIPAGWTDPRACGVAGAVAVAETCVREFGFAIVKMNPAQNRFPIDSPDVLEVTGRLLELGAVPAFHFGADTPFTPAEGLRKVAACYPERPLLAIHMGGGGAGYLEAESLCAEARRIGLEQPNIRFVLSAKRDAHIESDFIAYQLAGPPFCHNLFCGSDAPYGRLSWNFGGYRAMFASLMNGAAHTDRRVRANPGLFTPEAVQSYLGGNLARFAAAAYDHLLSVQTSDRVCR